MKKSLFYFLLAIPFCLLNAQTDWSVVSVPQEVGSEFIRITSDGDYVYMPIVKNAKCLQWDASRVMDIAPDGMRVAYLSKRNGSTNIFIKDLEKQGSSIQRTKRQFVNDFSYSPDGKNICFSEQVGKERQVFQTDAEKGYVCRQFTSGAIDCNPVYSADMSQVFFSRKEKKGGSIWSYNIKNNFLATFTAGEYPYPLKNETSYYCMRYNIDGRGEIWKINYESNLEECIVSDMTKGFSTPILSPDKQWLLFVGESVIVDGKNSVRNTDIYVCRPDGTDLTQLTFHPANDMCPVWSKNGDYIYFISQRGSMEKTPNIWRMSFIL